MATVMLRPFVRHELGVVIRFVDAFTGRTVDVPLDVRALALPLPLPPPPARPPDVPWRAVRNAGDATYRFIASAGRTLPSGVLEVTAEDPTASYRSFEPIGVPLPRPLVAHPPKPARSDFLVVRPLWPTRRAAIPPGETAVVGRVLSTGGTTTVSRLRVRLGVAPLPPEPYTYTDEHGDFLVRLPGLKARVVGNVLTATASLDVELLVPPAYSTSVVPTTPGFPLVVALGQVTVIEIRVP